MEIKAILARTFSLWLHVLMKKNHIIFVLLDTVAGYIRVNVQIYIYICSMQNVLFQNCVEQLFDSREVNVSKNGLFAEEFAHNVREWIAELETRVGEL